MSLGEVRELLLYPSEAAKLWLLGCLSVMLVLLAYLTLVASGIAHVTLWINDVFALIAGAYRAYEGQVPSIDFASGYGAVVYYPTSLGLATGLSPGAALAFGQVVVASVLLAAATFVSYRRFDVLPAAILIVYLFMLIVAPVPLGMQPADHSFGAMYNRHGWAALTIAALYYVEPRAATRRKAWLDGVVLALLLLFMVYNKINYAVVAIAFAVANAGVSQFNRRVSATALAIVVVALAAVELAWGYNAAYLRDIAYLASLNAQRLFPVGQVLEPALESTTTIAACAIGSIILLLSGRRRVVDTVFLAGAIAVCTLLATQSNAGIAEAPALLAVLVCFGELARREEATSKVLPSGATWSTGAGYLATLGLLVVVASKLIVVDTVGLLDYWLSTSRDAAASERFLDSRQAGLRVNTAYSRDMHDVLGHDAAAHSLLADIRRVHASDLKAAQYLRTVEEGLGLIERYAEPRHALVVFDMTDPFSAILRLRPTRYGYPMFWVDAGFSRATHPPPDKVLSDADFAMVPVVPYAQHHLDEMLAIYGGDLEQAFEVCDRSPHWTLWVRRFASAGETCSGR